MACQPCRLFNVTLDMSTPSGTGPGPSLSCSTVHGSALSALGGQRGLLLDRLLHSCGPCPSCCALQMAHLPVHACLCLSFSAH